jgi:YD repeat-containing protein
VVTDPLSHAIDFGYDSFGRRTTITDALSHTTTTTYAVTGRVTRVTAHDGTHTDFGKSSPNPVLASVIYWCGRPMAG